MKTHHISGRTASWGVGGILSWKGDLEEFLTLGQRAWEKQWDDTSPAAALLPSHSPESWCWNTFSSSADKCLLWPDFWWEKVWKWAFLFLIISAGLFPTAYHPAPSYQLICLVLPSHANTAIRWWQASTCVTTQLWPCRRAGINTLTICTSLQRKKELLHPAVLQRTPTFEQCCFNKGYGLTCSLLP